MYTYKINYEVNLRVIADAMTTSISRSEHGLSVIEAAQIVAEALGDDKYGDELLVEMMALCIMERGGRFRYFHEVELFSFLVGNIEPKWLRLMVAEI